jgi:hypothetical protein
MTSGCIEALTLLVGWADGVTALGLGQHRGLTLEKRGTNHPSRGECPDYSPVCSPASV